MASNIPQSACPESVLEGCDMLDLSRRCSSAHDHCTYIRRVSSLVVSRAKGQSTTSKILIVGQNARIPTMSRRQVASISIPGVWIRSTVVGVPFLKIHTTVAGMASMSSVVSWPSADLWERLRIDLELGAWELHCSSAVPLSCVSRIPSERVSFVKL